MNIRKTSVHDYIHVLRQTTQPLCCISVFRWASWLSLSLCETLSTQFDRPCSQFPLVQAHPVDLVIMASFIVWIVSLRLFISIWLLLLQLERAEISWSRLCSSPQRIWKGRVMSITHFCIARNERLSVVGARYSLIVLQFQLPHFMNGGLYQKRHAGPTKQKEKRQKQHKQ